ncbi:hypothetical protein Adt_48146 [Abeliophyllum distichum]|uniref:Uncharacterized protein n=1 Tax=Abeliophyllum distichum TaxID=126358 RepID=A0ABD1NRV2_9LAMI
MAKELFSTFESFDTEEAKSKKLSEDLKATGIEKAQLESEKRALQFKLDLVVTKEADMRAKYEIELKATKECLKQAQDQRRTTEASQKRAEEAQKSSKAALATTNRSLEAAVADKEKSLALAKLELEKVRAERANAEVKAVEAYQDAFVDTPEYQDLERCLTTCRWGAIGGVDHGNPSRVGHLFFSRGSY